MLAIQGIKLLYPKGTDLWAEIYEIYCKNRGDLLYKGPPESTLQTALSLLSIHNCVDVISHPKELLHMPSSCRGTFVTIGTSEKVEFLVFPQPVYIKVFILQLFLNG